MGTGRVPGQGGFTYLGVLFLIVLMGLGLAGTGQLWSLASQRAKERELLWVGNQYAQALRSYYRSSPGVSLYPSRLEELLEDPRFPQVRRHLRRLYPDPVTGNLDWGLVRSIDGRIAGVYSRSTQRPLKQARFPSQWAEFEQMGSYADWRFVADKSFLLEAGGSSDIAR
ncbi:type II secretory pathway, pseudopilin PulG [Zobellella endophytica]|uniref:Type II secretory pathway, pseudopilin PulG n=1 Tax=Zobellella endophytica TaxID=2116700 RepID=A0A2P7R958_9GAMM|nr:type II secretion system protein [Zobellella endophytica]PSJ46739.1 type II secretory pathway, pseudopilin PulG [Zobellella endophytica]